MKQGQSLNATYNRYPDLDRGPRRVVIYLIGLLTLVVISTLVWMNIARLDISVHALGQVTPSTRLQKIQSFEGGIIREIAVREGQHVKKGDLLVRVENLEFNSELGELRQKYWGQLATINRLEGELKNQPPIFDKVITLNALEIVSQEKALWHSRQKEHQSAINAASGQIEQRRQDLNNSRSKIRALETAAAISREQLSIEEELFSEGAGSRADYLSARQKLARQEGELESERINASRIEASIHEAIAQKAQLESAWRAESSQQLSELSTSTAALRETLSGKKDKVSRRELTAPRDGIVNRLLLNTVGGVARSGETIMEIVPQDDRLLVTVKVQPKDIAFIQPGQTAQIRVSAFDSSVYGALPGKVTRVGADAVLDGQDNAFFEVDLETERGYTGVNGKPIRISPGMTVDASILTGQRTLMEYMLKPIVKTLDTSLTER